MTPSTIIVGTLVLLGILALGLAIKMAGLSRVQLVPLADNYKPSFWLLLVLTIGPTFFFVLRDDRSALLTEGLSVFNYMVALAGVTAFLYGGYRLARRPVLLNSFLTGPRVWFTVLVLIYGLSSLWSVYPPATAFRAMELMGYALVCAHLFQRKHSVELLYRFLFIYLAFTCLRDLPYSIGNIAGGIYFSFSRSNTMALLAAAFLLLHVYLRPRDVLGYLLGVYGFIGFGSAATLAGSVVAGTVFLGLWRPTARKSFILAPLVAAQVALFMLMLFFPAAFLPLTLLVAGIIQKDPQLLLTATGRLPIWDVYLDFSLNQPFGQGFWAADRLFAVYYGEFLSWAAPHAHNAFLAAWLGAGFAGLAVLVLLFGSSFLHALSPRNPHRAVHTALVILLFLNSFTHFGIGGQFSLWYAVFLATLFHPRAVRAGQDLAAAAPPGRMPAAPVPA